MCFPKMSGLYCRCSTRVLSAERTAVPLLLHCAPPPAKPPSAPNCSNKWWRRESLLQPPPTHKHTLSPWECLYVPSAMCVSIHDAHGGGKPLPPCSPAPTPGITFLRTLMKQHSDGIMHTSTHVAPVWFAQAVWIHVSLEDMQHHFQALLSRCLMDEHKRNFFFKLSAFFGVWILKLLTMWAVNLMKGPSAGPISSERPSGVRRFWGKWVWNLPRRLKKTVKQLLHSLLQLLLTEGSGGILCSGDRWSRFTHVRHRLISRIWCNTSVNERIRLAARSWCSSSFSHHVFTRVCWCPPTFWINKTACAEKHPSEPIRNDTMII